MITVYRKLCLIVNNLRSYYNGRAMNITVKLLSILCVLVINTAQYKLLSIIILMIMMMIILIIIINNNNNNNNDNHLNMLAKDV